ncbi:Sir2 silent information regulator family NAD-dependent deacetylase [Lactobacillus sp. LL6]|uniref:Sir2 silent information regulator family NAD-dependent deacetylase n=1 Tax=Lactobacillus sp. LL6 TaxID=2596827 RepID=UPI001184DA88|nr:Sir2 silent information regulator family NAD-dependent deacetylase [Lactobacillus sp. LL6]TSO25557.1 Sir2 silent information regulator family NAD-dependent deacetylase [Lactobacillus sp. LL6]
MNNYSTKITNIHNLLTNSDSIVIGAGSGLSTAAGMTYSGARFEKYFPDFAKKYGITDMYSGGFYPFENTETYWAYWSRNIWVNRYIPAPKDTYRKLLQLVKDKNYFVITTNVDHQFQKAGFSKNRLFYTQGDYGLFQKKNNDGKTYDNYSLVKQMILSQGFEIGQNNELIIPKNGIKTKISSKLAIEANQYIKNLREDDNFLEDDGWHQAAQNYQHFLEDNSDKKVVYFEIGVGMNTPGIIKYPFWKFTYNNPQAHFITIDTQKPFYPEEIAPKSISVEADINDVLNDLVK